MNQSSETLLFCLYRYNPDFYWCHRRKDGMAYWGKIKPMIAG